MASYGRRRKRAHQTVASAKPPRPPMVGVASDALARFCFDRLFLALGATRARRRRLGQEVNELEEDHLGRVARAWPDAHDARVAALPVGEAGPDVAEELVHDVLRTQVGE